MDSLNSLTWEASATQAYQVHACIAYWLLAGNDVGRNVLRGARATLEHNVAAHLAELVEQAGGTDDGIVIDLNFASKLCGVADDTAVAYNTVVGDMHIFHQQVS